MIRITTILTILTSWLAAQPTQIYFGEMNYVDNYLEIMVEIDEIICGYQFTIQGLDVTYIQQVMWPECYGGISDNGTVVGWFATGLPLDPGSGVMVNLFIADDEDAEVCIIDSYFADCYGNPPIFPEIGDCIFIDYEPLLIPGDINGDGWIDITDIVSIVSMILAGEEHSAFEFYISDLNDDSSIDILDIVWMVQIVMNQ